MSKNIKVEVQRDENSPWIKASAMAGPKIMFSLIFIYFVISMLLSISTVEHMLPSGAVGFFFFLFLFFAMPVVLLELLSRAIKNYNVGLPSALVGFAILGIYVFMLAMFGGFNASTWMNPNAVFNIIVLSLFYFWAVKKAFERPFVVSRLIRQAGYYELYTVKAEGDNFNDERNFYVYKAGNTYVVKEPMIGITVEAKTIPAGIEMAKQQYISLIEAYQERMRRELFGEEPEKQPEPQQKEEKQEKREQGYSCYS